GNKESLGRAVIARRFFFSSRRRHTRWPRDWSSDVCSSDLLLSPELAAGIRRVGIQEIGCSLRELVNRRTGPLPLAAPKRRTPKSKRDRAILAVLLGCGLRRRELSDLTLDHLQRREEHWAIIDLVGKGRHIRTVPVPDWVKRTIDDWLTEAGVTNGRLFRRVCRAGTVDRKSVV